MFFQMAWRNIWRHPRRTLVILTAVVIGVWSMIFLGALLRGMVDGMIKNGISTLTGHIQIHQENYRNDPVVDNSMQGVDKIEAALGKILPDGAKYAERIRVNAIANNARHSAAITLVGIDPEKERGVSFIGEGVVEGKHLSPVGQQGIVIGKALLDKFETRIGHKLVLMAQDSQKEIVSKSFRIIGVFRAEMESTEKNFVFVSLPAAQKMLKVAGEISEISIILPERGMEEEITKKIMAKFGTTGITAETWKELIPFLRANLDIFNQFMYIWYLVVFAAMGFGIVNTMLMAIFERMREFGLLKALGMKPFWILRSVLTESLFLLVLGTTLGNILGFLFVYAAAKTGIDLSALAAGTEMWGMTRIIFPVIAAQDVLVANFTVLILGLLVSAYPAIKAARFSPVEAMMMN
jgi:ABC-type lipoprotein release transport system permease subunit